jgi:autotransporter-associated beta strand protein
MKPFQHPNLAVLAAAAALLFFGSADVARAADVNWSNAQPITSSTDVVNAGTPLLATAYSSTAGTTVVNGVTFIASGGLSTTQNGITAALTGWDTNPSVGAFTPTLGAGFTGTNTFTGADAANYKTILDSSAWNAAWDAQMTVQVTGLTVGERYVVQFFAANSSGGGNSAALNNTSGSDINGQNMTVGNPVGTSVIGAFTADATTQSFTLRYGWVNGIYLNAFQLRQAPVPVTWVNAQSISSSADVYNAGTPVLATYYSATPGTKLVNGVTFVAEPGYGTKTGANPLTTTQNGVTAAVWWGDIRTLNYDQSTPAIGSGFTGANTFAGADAANYKTILDSCANNPNWWGAVTVNLTGLTLGQRYVVQFFSANSSGGGNSAALNNLSGADVNLQYLTVGNPVGTSVVGTFTATASRQNFTIQYGWSNGSYLNAFQLRAVPPASASTLTSVAVAPSTASLAPLGTQQFTATAYDQFGIPMDSQPPFTWSCIGSGSVSNAGLFTAGYSAGGATVTAAGGGFQGSSAISVASPLPVLWKGADLGATGVGGGSSYSGGVYTVNGSGADIGGSADAFQFNSQWLNGDGEIRARVVSQTNTDPAAKAGVMIRSGTGAGAVNALMALTPGGFTLQARAAADGATTTVGSATANAAPNNWVRLVRSGTLVTGYVSANGTSWTQVGTETLNLAATVSVGLAVSSHNNAAIGTATFDNLAVTPFPAPWQTMDIGATVQLGSAEYFNGSYTLKGAGTVGSTSDKFRFLYQAVNETSSEIIARISTLQNTSSNNARLGVMIRSGTSATAPYAFMGVSGAGAYTFQTRSTDGGTTTTTTGVNGTAPNIWVRVVRSGNSFSAYYKSSAGGTWTQVGTTMSITMGSTTCIGIVDASGNTTGLNTSVFDNVGGSSITSTPLGAGPLTSFEDAALVALMDGYLWPSHTQSTQHVTDGTYSCRVDFPVGDYPSVNLPASMFPAGANWSTAGAMMFDVFNASTVPMNLLVTVHDTAGGQWTTTVTLPPGLQQRVAVGLHSMPGGVGMNGYPFNYACNADLFGFLAIPTSSTVSNINLWLANPVQPQTAYFDNFRLVDVPPLVNLIDAYGQFTLCDWPGKAHSDQDLVTAHSTEAASLAAQNTALQGSTDRDSYGGWAAGPQLAATGWFRTQQVNGKWWLVTPSGHLFWSAGLQGVVSYRPDYTNSANASLFFWFPAASDPLYAFCSGSITWGSIDFYEMNLYRTYGSNWQTSWLAQTKNRMAAWGFNTNGPDQTKPFISGLSYNGRPSDVTSDIYSSAWVTGVYASINSQVTGSNALNANPNCIGYTVDNEIAWSAGLPVNALGLPGSYAVKVAFTAILQNKYSTIGALNTAWGISAASWTDFQASPVALPTTHPAALDADLSLLLSAYANQFYSTLAAAIKQYAPNQLYLGSRFGGRPPDAVAVAAGNNCDVVSYNVYGTGATIASYGPQVAMYNKPVIFTEFHFGALDRGLFWGGMVAVPNQEARGTSYAEYVNTALTLPWCVGTHWFQFFDEPFSGRGDSENGNLGFVSVADVPYPELVNHATAVNLNIYNIRGAAVGGTPATITTGSVTGNSANLSVTGGVPSGGTDLKYTWTVTGTAPGTATFTPNGTGGAANTTATFTQPGTYHFRVTITDALGEATTSDLSVTTHDWTQSTIILNGTVIAGNLLFGDSTPGDHWSVITGSGGPLTLSGSAGSPAITINNQPVTIDAVLTGTQGLSKSGTGMLFLTNANTYTGDTKIKCGVLDLGVAGRLYANALNTTAVVTLYPGTALRLAGWGSNTPGMGMLDCGPDRLVVNGGTIEWTGASAGSGSRGFTVGPVGATLKASGLGLWTLAHSGTPAYDTITNNSGLILDGSGTAQLGMDITGTGSLTKTGSGTWILTGSNSHTGATTVSQGILQVLGLLAPGSPVVVSATGTLSGTGTLGGPVTVNGILAPGTGTIGSLKVSNTLTLAGTATMRISKSGSALSNDSVLGMSAVSYGGALVVSNIGGSVLAEGDAFTLFTSGSYTGTFSSITLPALTGSLIWDTSKLAVKGSIKVTVPVVPPAAPAGFTATAGNAQVALGWSSAVGAAGYNVKRSTVSGSNYITILNNTAATSYTDTGLTNWTTYYYVVSAINAGGEGANSTQAAAQPQSPPISAAERNASSKISLSGSAGTMNFKSSVIGHTYQLQTIDSLTSGTWTNYGSAQPGTGADLNFAVPYDNSVPRRFYRLQIRQ